MVDTVEMTYLDAVFANIIEEMENIQLARDFFNGIQGATLSTRQQQYLQVDGDIEFRLNVCHTVVNALANELKLAGYDTNEKSEGEDNVKKVAAWANELYKEANLDTVQSDIHEGAISDSETFLIIEFDEAKQRATFTLNQTLVTTEAGGDGFGAFMKYENNDINQDPLYCVKQWVETIYNVNGEPTTRTRRTVYYPDRIERHVYSNGWQPFVEVEIDKDGKETPVPAVQPWVDKKGNPLGIPVVHYINKKHEAEHWEAIPTQRAINKTFVDVLAANDLTAFKSFFGFGFFPTVDGKAPKEDGSNLMQIGPAQFNGVTKLPTEAELQEIEGADNTPLLNSMKDYLMFVAQITDTPTSRFVVTAQVASDKTIKAQKQALQDKAIDRRARFGDKWVQAMEIARKLTNFFATESLDLDEDVTITPIWTIDRTLEEISAKIEKVGITQKQAWIELGYSPEEIAEMQADPEYRIKFSNEIWAGYDIAVAANNMSLEAYLISINIPEEERTALLAAQGTAVPAISQ